MVVVVVIGGNNLSSLTDVDCGLTYVGEVISGDDLHIRNTTVGYQAGPWI